MFLGAFGITALPPKLRLEMIATRSDKTALNALAASPPPTVLVGGEQTRIAPRAVARRLAEAFRAPATVVVPGAGHMLPLTHPAAIAEAVRSVRSLLA